MIRARRNGCRVLVIGHVATWWGLDHFINGVPLERLAPEGLRFQEGWEYRAATLNCICVCAVQRYPTKISRSLLTPRVASASAGPPR
jgi:hypothetical protein